MEMEMEASLIQDLVFEVVDNTLEGISINPIDSWLEGIPQRAGKALNLTLIDSFVEEQDGLVVNILQTQVVKQTNQSQNCGLYAVFNALIMSRALASQEENEAEEWCKCLQSRSSFWKFALDFSDGLDLHFGHSQNQRNLNMEWAFNPKGEYVLERVVVQDLTSHAEVSAATSRHVDAFYDFTDTFFHPQHCTNLLEFGLGSLRLNQFMYQTAARLEQVVKMLKSDESPFSIHRFLVGVSIHWVSVVVSKREHEYDIMMLDSMNKPIVRPLDETHIRHLLDNMDFSRWPFPLELMEKFARDSIGGVHLFLHLLKDALLGRVNIGEELLRINMEGFVHSYVEHCLFTCGESMNTMCSSKYASTPQISCSELVDILQRKDNIDVSSWQPLLLNWVNSYYPVPILYQNVLYTLMNISEESVNSYTRRLLCCWIDHIRSLLNSIDMLESTQYSTFATFVEDLETFLTSSIPRL